MRKALAVLVIPLMLSGFAADAWAESTRIPLSGEEPGIRLLGRKNDGLTFRITLGRLSVVDVTTPEGEFARLSLPGFHASKEIGKPELPMANRLLEIPHGAKMSVEVLGFETHEIALSDVGVETQLLPVQPSVRKDANRETLEFHVDRTIYTQNRDYGIELARAVDLGRMRGVRIGRLEVAPVAYNPGSGTLTVREHIDVAVRFSGADAKGDTELKAATTSPFFEPVYRMLAGYKGYHDTYPDLLTGPVTYVIVSDSMFQGQLQPFVEWKTEQGFEVIEAYTDDPQVGADTTSIRAYLHDLYEGGTPKSPAPTFVLFVGDVLQIPAFTRGGCTTDLPYCDVTGDDIPEMYYGRFSAGTTSELQPQIDKTLEHEMYEMTDPSYLGEAVMIAGYDYSYAATHANGQINYATTYYVNPAHGVESHTYLHPESQAQDAAVISDVSAGCGFVNYTAHGSIVGWNDPAFSRYDVADLENAHEYPLIIANCCLTSSFSFPACFAESWLREENGGAVAYIGASSATYWDEDYDWAVGNDGVSGVEFVDPSPTYEETGLGVYDGMFHDRGEEFGQWYIAADAHIFCGNLAVMESGSLHISYYWEIYNLMGDPSLAAYLGVPDEHGVTLPGSIDPLDTEVNVAADPKSYVGITEDGVLLGSALVGQDGTAVVPISPPGGKGNIHVVVTAQNKIPYRADIPVTAVQENCLLASADSLDFGGVIQGVRPGASISLWNLCTGSQEWAVTRKPDWLSADPESGTLASAPTSVPVSVTLNVDTLQVGATYTDLVQFESAEGICSLYVSVEVRDSDLLAAPVIRSPRDSVVVASLTPSLVVENAPGKGTENLWVHFEIDTSLTFSSPVLQLSGAVAEGDSTAEWQPADLAENALCFWRAWRADAYAVGDTSEPAAFYVNSVNECPYSLSPSEPAADSTIVNRRPTLRWGLTADPDPGDAVSYRVFLQADEAWDSLYAGSAGELQWPDSLADNSSYRWKVAADDEHGCRTWSVTWRFSINLENDAPAPFALVSPDSSGVSSTLRPTFQWGAAEDPDPDDTVAYWIWFSPDSLFLGAGKGDSVFVGAATEYTPDEDLSDNTVYFWKVLAEDAEKASVCTPVWRFAADTAPPSFTFAIFQNPVLDRYLDFYAVPSESLCSEPVASLLWNDFHAIAEMTILDSSLPIYHADFEIPESACGTAELLGCDPAYVCGRDTLAFCSYWITEGSPARIASPDGRAELLLPAGAAPRDLLITVFPRDAQAVALLKSGGIEGLTGESLWVPEMGRRRPIGRAYGFGPSGSGLDAEATLSFEYSREELQGEPEWKLGLYRLEEGEWRRLGGSRATGSSSVSAPVLDLGVYQLQLDPERQRPAPGTSALCQNYPNPFNPSTTIVYEMADEARVSVRIYGVDGRLVRDLVDTVKPAGRHSLAWDGTDGRGERVASGVYFCAMKSEEFVDVRRLVLLK